MIEFGFRKKKKKKIYIYIYIYSEQKNTFRPVSMGWSVVLPTNIQPTQPIANGAMLGWMRPTANKAPFLVTDPAHCKWGCAGLDETHGKWGSVSGLRKNGS